MRTQNAMQNGIYKLLLGSSGNPKNPAVSIRQRHVRHPFSYEIVLFYPVWTGCVTATDADALAVHILVLRKLRNKYHALFGLHAECGVACDLLCEVF